MRKITILILCLLLVAVMALPASAAGSASLSPSTTTPYRGDTFTVAIKLSGTAKATAGSISVSYGSGLELTDGKCSINGVNLVPDLAAGRFIFYSMQAADLNTTVVTLTFKVKSNAAFEQQNISATLQINEESITGSTKVTVTCKHSYGSWSKTDASVHKRTCGICGGVETKAHSYSNGCDTSCNDCGATRKTTHNFSTKWSSDGKNHWHACSICGIRNDSAAHVPGAPATEDNPQTCTVCGYVLVPALEHVHVPDESFQYDETGHWHICTKCGGNTELTEHVYDFDCDAQCNECDYIRDTDHVPGENWESDAVNHWRVCEICEEILQKQPHNSDGDSVAPQCMECGYLLNHEHAFDGNWRSDQDTHWHECDCGAKDMEAAHTWGEGVMTKAPQNGENGIMTYSCSVCGEKKTAEVIETVVQGGSDVRPWQIACAALAAALLGSLIFMIVVIAKISKKPKGKYAGR